MKFDFDDFFRGLDWSKAAIKEGAKEGMEDALEHLLRESRDLAPLSASGGRLRESGKMQSRVVGEKVEGEVSFSVVEETESGEAYDYAVITHELGESYKNPTTPGTQPKYLERPLKQNADKYQEMIANGIKKGLGR